MLLFFEAESWAMYRYKRLSGNYAQMVGALFSKGPQQFQSDIARHLLVKESKEAYVKGLRNDIDRTAVVDFNRTANDVLNTIFNPEHYEESLFFMQGIFEAGVIQTYIGMLYDSEYFRAEIMGFDHTVRECVHTIHFAYIDDNQVNCGLTIQRIGLDKNGSDCQRYTIALSRNTSAHPEDHEIICICEQELLGLGPFDNASEHLQEVDLDESNIFESFQHLIRSEKIVELIHPIFQNGQISMSAFDALEARTSGPGNIDDRDNRKKRFDVWMNQIAQINSSFAEEQRNLSTDIHFFERNRYTLYLKKMLDIEPVKSDQSLIVGCNTLLDILKRSPKEEKTDFNFTEFDSNAEKIAMSDVEFVQNMMDRAKNILRSRPPSILLSPQGRVLVPIQQQNMIVSLDSQSVPEFYAQYSHPLKSALNQSDVAHQIIKLLDKSSGKNSIIPLYEEFYFHLALTRRVYENVFYSQLNDKKNELIAAFDEAMKEVNQLVMRAFADALIAATQGISDWDNAALDLVKLNQHLDRARGKIAPTAHDILLAQIRKKTGCPLTSDKLSAEIIKVKERAELTTAVHQDILHIDDHLRLATRIEGSYTTAHDRRLGQPLANRQIATYQLSEDGQTIIQSIDRVQIRIPSLPLKQGLQDEQYIKDVQGKLKSLSGKYDRSSPFTYYLLTALHDNMDDLATKNAQTQSARHIILGTHAYNREMAIKSPNLYPLCYVQAMSVNGFGSELGYHRFGFRTALRNEITLMAEMALLRHVPDNIGVLNDYQTFLELAPQKQSWWFTWLFGDSQYFAQTTSGKQAKLTITKAKRTWQEEQCPVTNETDLKSLVSFSLQKIMAFDLHFQHDYAKLIQTLSLFLEKQSLIGCKSGNERTPMICLRAQLLDQPCVPEDIKNAFVTLAKATSKTVAKAATAALKNVIDKHYNDENIYGATALISLLDQGAGHKIQASKGLWDMNRNHAEERSIQNLQQKHVKAMQAHNGLADYMLTALRKPVVAENVCYLEDNHIPSSNAAIALSRQPLERRVDAAAVCDTTPPPAVCDTTIEKEVIGTNPTVPEGSCATRSVQVTRK